MPAPRDWARAKRHLVEAAGIRRSLLAPFLTDAHGRPKPKHEAGDLVAIDDETYRVGYAKGDTLLLERVRPTDVHRWDEEAGPADDMRSSRQMDRLLRKAELGGEFPPRGGW